LEQLPYRRPADPHLVNVAASLAGVRR